jgi:hypothetical protein
MYCILFYVDIKGTGNETDFLGFLQKLVSHESLTLPFEPFWCRLRIYWDIRIWNTTPRYHKYGESPTPRITDMRRRQLPASLIRESEIPPITNTESWLLNFLKENSLYRWYRESSTPCTSDTVSCQLPGSLSWRVAESAYHRHGELTTPHIVESGSRGVDDSADRWYGESLFKEKINLLSIFRTFNG